MELQEIKINRLTDVEKLIEELCSKLHQVNNDLYIGTSCVCSLVNSKIEISEFYKSYCVETFNVPECNIIVLFDKYIRINFEYYAV